MHNLQTDKKLNLTQVTVRYGVQKYNKKSWKLFSNVHRNICGSLWHPIHTNALWYEPID